MLDKLEFNRRRDMLKPIINPKSMESDEPKLFSHKQMGADGLYDDSREAYD